MKIREYKQLPSSQYELNLSFEIEKYRDDKIGTEQAVDFDDYIYVGVYAEDESELYYELHRFSEQDNQVRLILEDEPALAGIDPRGLTDRVSGDNLVVVIRK